MKPSEKISRARMSILLDDEFIFYSSLLCNLDMVETNSIQTFATDGRRIYYSPTMCEALDVPTVKTIILHEILHCVLMHPFRVQNRNHEKFNIACDYAINLMIQDVIDQKKSTLSWPKDNYAPLLDKKWANMSAEEIYAKLPDNPKNKSFISLGEVVAPKSEKGDKDKDNKKGDKGNEEGEGNSEGNSASDEELKELEENWKIAVVAAAQQASMRGKLPASLKQLVETLIEPPRGWKDILKDFISSLAKDDYNFLKPNRRHIGRGFVLPSLHSHRMPPIVVCIDSSGSVDNQLFAEFMAQVDNIRHEVRPEKLHLIDADAAVENAKEFDSDDEIPKERYGCGGTAFSPAIKYVEDNGIECAVLIYFTDGDGAYPSVEPSYPVIWCMPEDCLKRHKPPFGLCIPLK
jgi:predicted metal-dependent peptidase